MSLTKMCLLHVDSAAELEKKCFSRPWSKHMLQGELLSDIGYYLAYEIDGRLAGYAGMQVIVDEGYITNIAVDPEHRRKGVGGALLDGLVEHALERGLCFITLEVRESNAPAQGLYTRRGFCVTGLRRGYYEKPREDALIMTLDLTGKRKGGV